MDVADQPAEGQPVLSPDGVAKDEAVTSPIGAASGTNLYSDAKSQLTQENHSFAVVSSRGSRLCSEIIAIIVGEAALQLLNLDIIEFTTNPRHPIAEDRGPLAIFLGVALLFWQSYLSFFQRRTFGNWLMHQYVGDAATGKRATLWSYWVSRMHTHGTAQIVHLLTLIVFNWSFADYLTGTTVFEAPTRPIPIPE